MNRNTLRNLGIVLALLVAVLVGLEMSDRDAGTTATGQALFDGLKDRINDIETVTVEAPGEDPVVVRRGEAGWVVANRDDYPASLAKVRQVLLALADAQVLERMTSNPERYEALGVQDPETEGAGGVRLRAAGGGAEFAVIVGDASQGSNRYVRPAGEATSLLIDANPDIPADVGGWLASDLVDVDTAAVREVTIEHADGETLRIAKAAPEDADFEVADLPEGRELSYPTVANSIAGALNDLTLEDVRPPSGGEGGEAATTTTLLTFDGLRVVVSSYDDDDEAAWISLAADVAEVPAADAADENSEEEAVDDAADDEADADDGPGAEERAALINERAAGREFRIPQYKANQLTRRWEDILQAEEPESDEE